ncbi:hypothetical protein EDD22DRAFT_950430 [Suillus occidentalis]|nr:hypothetical protein EDD22DRAFT_950430 [Suillus occidentalis]
MDCETKNKLQLLSLYLQNLPKTIPLADPSSPQYGFDFFILDDENIEDYGPIGALNQELKLRMGQRDKGPVSFKERGPSLNAVTDVLGGFLDQYHESPETVLLVKWVDDLTIAAVAAFKTASIELPSRMTAAKPTVTTTKKRQKQPAVNPMAGPTLTITQSATGVITCATKPPQNMVTRAAAGKYPDPVTEMKQRNPTLAEFSPTDALASFRTQFQAYIKGVDPFNRKMRSNESALDWWKMLQVDELANVLAPLAIKAFSVSPTSMPDECTMSTINWLNSPQRSRQEIGTLQDHIKIRQWHHFDSNKLKTPYKPLVKWCDMESTILGKRAATEDLPAAGRTPPPPEARPIESNSDSEDEFDDGADWLNDSPALAAEFKMAEKGSFVLAASNGIDLRAPYLRELLDSIGKQPSQSVSGLTTKAAA